MKTIYSLQEFRQEILKLAEKRNETYTVVNVEINYNGQIKFSAYIYGLSWNDGASMEDCLRKIKDKIEPPNEKSNNNIDVEIDIEHVEEMVEEIIVQDKSAELPDDLPF